MSYTDPNDPVRTDTHVVDTRSDSGVTWFIVGALVIAAGVLAYLYFGEDSNMAADTGTAIEAPADSGRASTPDMAPAPTPSAPAAPEPAAPAAPMAPPAPAAPSAP